MSSATDRTTRGDEMESPAVPGPYVTGYTALLSPDDMQRVADDLVAHHGIYMASEDNVKCGTDHIADTRKMVMGEPKRGAILLEAHRIINGERQQQYGSPEDSHTVIAKMWNGYLRAREDAGCGHGLDASDVAHMMVLFKLARQINGAGKRDNYVDAAGYLGIASDIQDSRTQEVRGGR